MQKVGQLRSADVDGSDSWSTKRNGTCPGKKITTRPKAARLDMRILNCSVFIPPIRLEQLYQIEYSLFFSKILV
jgi:hypothetical protein